MALERLGLFGIRHHGPGSARSLLAALHELDPAIVLIEGRIRADASPAELLKSDDADVRAMIDVPRRQAERLAAL